MGCQWDCAIPKQACHLLLMHDAHAVHVCMFVPVQCCMSVQLSVTVTVLQILWTYILSQAAAATVSAHQPVAKGEEPEPLTIPQQVAVFITEDEQVAAMQLVVEELASTPNEDETPTEPAPA